MNSIVQQEDWVWVVVQDPETEAQILGQRDEEKDIAFIPTFLRKEESYQCLHLLVRQPGKKYEAQAIIYEDLVRYASENGLMIFILNGEGQVLNNIRV